MQTTPPLILRGFWQELQHLYAISSEEDSGFLPSLQDLLQTMSEEAEADPFSFMSEVSKYSL